MPILQPDLSGGESDGFPQPSSFASATLTGKDLIDLANYRLGGYENALDSERLLSLLNEGKDELWGIIKSTAPDYFIAPTQAIDATQPNYFGPLNPAVREYTLPPDFREMDAIEVTGPADYVGAKFRYVKINTPEWKRSRGYSNGGRGSGSSGEILYTIVGRDQLMLAEYPESALQLVLWYVRGLPDFDSSATIDGIVLPYAKKIADYAVKKAMLALQDQPQFDRWRQEWRDDIINLVSAVGPRNQESCIFVQDFEG